MKDILLLHGAIGSSRQLEPLATLLSDRFKVHLLNFSGHGGNEFKGEFSMELFAESVLKYIDDNNIPSISFFGYSMGGYVALYFAQKYPHRTGKIITLATKFYWDEAVAAKETKMLQPEIIEEKLPSFAQELAARHAPADWKTLLQQTQQLLNGLGKSSGLEYSNIVSPCLIMLGDRDKMVGMEETVNAYRALPSASLAILPQTSHPVEKADNELLKFYIEKFLL